MEDKFEQKVKGRTGADCNKENGIYNWLVPGGCESQNSSVFRACFSPRQSGHPVSNCWQLMWAMSGRT